MVSANREMAVYCFDTLVAHYNDDEAPLPAVDDGQYPLFVTWKKVINGGEPRLRGCIGTLEARWLVSGLKDYALNSALRDRRFPPIQPKELPFLECTVSILTDYKTANNYLDWEVGKHGIIIEFTDPSYNTRRTATYLPEIAAQEGKLSFTPEQYVESLVIAFYAATKFLGENRRINSLRKLFMEHAWACWTKIEAIDSLMRKAGYNGSITESLRRQIQMTRYQSTLFTMLYSEYVSYVKASRGQAPSIHGGKPGKP